MFCFSGVPGPNAGFEVAERLNEINSRAFQESEWRFLCEHVWQ